MQGGNLLNLEQAEGLVLGHDLPSPVPVQVDRETIGAESKLFGHLL